ncbi:MAG TPA: ATP-binding cassette domain-containing protein [Polyangiaceae bacterium]|jgi:ABC-2 type transport system ATP-binding protein|nr:ATP-binding cassette domain-containing protein [Polyangiaceae bacterium]
MTIAVELRDLRKSFRGRAPSAPSFMAAVRGLVSAKSTEFRAVDGISFCIEEGERVAFIGPNGAGKSTTLKILSGILQPDSGHVRVLGLTPAQDRVQLGYRIGTVFGQRSQLWQHLPANDTFRLLASVYDLPEALFRSRLATLVEVFALAPLMSQPVRKLSLGERMRCELAASLLHAPRLLFLDEPTIGLDVTAKARVRELVREQSERDGTSVLLTSHDTGDSEQVCERVIVINHGKLLFDQSLSSLRARFITHKRVTLVSDRAKLVIDLPGVRVIEREPYKTSLEVDLKLTPVARVVEAALAGGTLHDLSVEDPPLERVVQAIYESASDGRQHEHEPERAAS